MLFDQFVLLVHFLHCMMSFRIQLLNLFLLLCQLISQLLTTFTLIY